MGYTIIGAGMAGLLAGAMLRSDVALIVEKQKAIPHNHSALLRFRSSVVGDVLGIPFKKVSVLKTVAPWRNPVADALAYSKKCTGTYTLRSSLSAKAEMETRYIAPDLFISQMAMRIQAPAKFGSDFDFVKYLDTNTNPIISTIPMPALMDVLEYDGERPTFKGAHGGNLNCIVSDADAYATIYVPNPDIAFNRVSLTGNKLTIEYSTTTAEKVTFDERLDLKLALSMLGMAGAVVHNVEVSDQKYSKILATDDALRKRFILWATEKHNVYSLGRFATWRPGLLLDDVVNDVRVIQNISVHGSYSHRK